MKLVDLHKNKGLKIASQIKPFGAPPAHGTGAPPVIDRREQRRLDQAQGLVAFACKLNSDLLKELQARAQVANQGINETVADLLTLGLAHAQASPVAAVEGKAVRKPL